MISVAVPLIYRRLKVTSYGLTLTGVTLTGAPVCFVLGWPRLCS
jgi:hypothetical protein